MGEDRRGCQDHPRPIRSGQGSRYGFRTGPGAACHLLPVRQRRPPPSGCSWFNPATASPIQLSAVTCTAKRMGRNGNPGGPSARRPNAANAITGGQPARRPLISWVNGASGRHDPRNQIARRPLDVHVDGPPGGPLAGLAVLQNWKSSGASAAESMTGHDPRAGQSHPPQSSWKGCEACNRFPCSSTTQSSGRGGWN